MNTGANLNHLQLSEFYSEYQQIHLCYKHKFPVIEHQYQFALQLKGDLQPIKQKIKENINGKILSVKRESEVKEKRNFILALPFL